MTPIQIRTEFPFALRRPLLHVLATVLFAWLAYSEGFRLFALLFIAFVALGLLLLLWSESLKAVELREDGFSILDGNRVTKHDPSDLQTIQVRRRFPGTYFLLFKAGSGSLALRYITPEQHSKVAQWAASQQVVLSSASPFGFLDLFSLFS